MMCDGASEPFTFEISLVNRMEAKHTKTQTTVIGPGWQTRASFNDKKTYKVHAVCAEWSQWRALRLFIIIIALPDLFIYSPLFSGWIDRLKGRKKKIAAGKHWCTHSQQPSIPDGRTCGTAGRVINAETSQQLHVRQRWRRKFNEISCEAVARIKHTFDW